MPEGKQTFYITSPIYYVNDVPHIGHAYTTMSCDFIARFKRLDGFDVCFLTGTDEHGQKIERSAEIAGVSPIDFVDSVSVKFRDLASKMNFSNDIFLRTSDSSHKNYVKQIWKKLLENGWIYEGKYCGWYSVRDEAFYNEQELVEGKAPTGAAVEWVEEKSYFFKLSAFSDRLLKFYADNPDFILPETRRNEVISFVKSGLHDLSISRTSFKWGIDVPDDKEHVMYVWLDALFNYLSGIGGDKSRYWPADLHIVGKDILRFHAIYWPAFLMAADMKTPKRVFAHGWWTNNGEKISKSLGNVIDPISLINQFGLDYVRYFLIREIPFGNDGNYSEPIFINRINSELVNNIGNLSQRVLAFIQRYCDGKVPNFSGVYTSEDESLLELSRSSLEVMRNLIDAQELNKAVGVIIDLGSAANEYIDKNAPWHLRSVDINRMNDVLFTLLEVIRVIAILLQPILPDSAQKLLTNLGKSDLNFSDIKNINQLFTSGSALPAPEVVFPRLTSSS